MPVTPVPQFPNDANNDGNTFLTTDLPDPDAERKQIASKRLFIVVLAVCAIIVGFIVWEIVELALGGRP